MEAIPYFFIPLSFCLVSEKYNLKNAISLTSKTLVVKKQNQRTQTESIYEIQHF